MANKKRQVIKTKPDSRAGIGLGSLWLAGVGAASLGRQRSALLIGDFVTEGRRLQRQASQTMREASADVRAQIDGALGTIGSRFGDQAGKAGAAFEAGISGLLARLGIASKSDIDALAQRVGALTRQLKATK